jgi:hypothetical protein
MLLNSMVAAQKLYFLSSTPNPIFGPRNFFISAFDPSTCTHTPIIDISEIGYSDILSILGLAVSSDGIFLLLFYSQIKP